MSDEGLSLSVVTINRNNALGLRHTIESVIGQQSCRSEWIFVDGSSDDDSVSVARALSTSLAATIMSEPDSGIYDAMNKGLRAATGDVVLFLNSGDSLTRPDVLVSATQRLTSTGASWGYGGVRYLDSLRQPRAAYLFAPFRLAHLAHGYRTVPHQAAYLRRELLVSLGGFRTDFGIAADQELLYRAALVEEPEAWVDLMADFEAGGLGSARRPWSFPLDMRHARADAHSPEGTERVAELVATLGVAALQTALTWQSRARSSVRAQGAGLRR
ncbi:MAG: glycosyltransferase [Actinobacteria bacterium]|uniref:Unannotated protein n=1 Tax=freshwater metagenome TaxID=449393 RepID=A0A6J7JGS3_9ZZZZ|nr:glycosyltransferase [Actinomycetota bacterium]